MNALLTELDERQYEDLYHVDDAPITNVRQTVLSQLGWWTVLFAIAGFTAGFIVKIPDMIQTAFVIKSEVSEEIYRFPSTVYVEKMHVRNGQSIRAGMPILELSAPDIAALANDLVTADNNLSSFHSFKTASARNERIILELNSRKIREDISLKEMQLTSLQTRWRSESLKLTYEAEESLRLLDQSKGFYKAGDVSKNDLNQAEANSLKARNAYEAANQTYLSERNTLLKQVTSQRLEISSIDKQINKNQNDTALEAERLQNTVLATKKRISGSFGAFAITDNNHLLLKATKSGTVSFVFDGEKEAQAGTILAKLIYKDAPLYAHIQVTSSQIGKVKIGQSVMMKVDAFPVYEWGAVKGQIANVSLTPDEKGLFTLTVKITDYNHLRKLMRIGMKGSSSLIFEDETLFGYVSRKFRKVTADLTD